MNLLIMGLPGCGKGTQSDLLVKKFNIKHLSTGNLFRNEIKTGSALGNELASYMNEGKLVPDELTIKLLKNELTKPDYQNGFLLDGFPRTLVQTEALEKMLVAEGIKLDKVLYLDLAPEVITKRLSGRLFCPTCQKTYHQTLNPPQEAGLCDDDKTPLITREDDKEESVKKRIAIASEQLKPMLDYYQERNLLLPIQIDESDDINQVFAKICEGL